MAAQEGTESLLKEARDGLSCRLRRRRRRRWQHASRRVHFAK
jgi:hypothetical protein